ncbi:hypothetical protein E2C01_051241 [Portunus trituberculatus]|uniref:Uncharacterized protein n=1 Tax=Portunus trituberculatus TaxID=210409 RepID=A0A5B7GIJ4_PORTR|nr:hypothetical protein [Portunus trituberculatus]
MPGHHISHSTTSSPRHLQADHVITLPYQRSCQGEKSRGNFTILSGSSPRLFVSSSWWRALRCLRVSPSRIKKVKFD